MILKGSQRGGGAALARHLLNEMDNDHIELHELRGFIADDLLGALREAEAISLGTRCRQFLFSLSLSPPASESVPVAAFEAAITDIEERMGLAGQPRAIVFHEKDGRRHAHCVWSRIDPETMTAINLPHFKLKLQDKARELFREHGWQMPRGLRDATERDPLNYDHAQGQQAKRAETDPKALKALLIACWERSDSKAALARALLEHGLVLARGDRRGFVVVDRQGEVYALSRWLGVKAKAVRARLGDGRDLPDVEAAQALLAVHLDDAPDELAEDGRREAAHERRRFELVSRQRQERRSLRETQRERATARARALRERLPTGWRAAWARASGRYQKLLREYAAEIARLRESHRAEQQLLVERQLEERRALGHAQQQLHREFRQAALRRETGRALAGLELGAGRPWVLPRVDPRQKLVLADEDEAPTAAQLRARPARILDDLARHEETFTRTDIARALARHIDEPQALRTAIDQVLRSPELVRIEDDRGERFTTATLRDARASLEWQTASLASDVGHAVSRDMVNAAIAEQSLLMRQSVGASLSTEQEAAIRHVTGPEGLSVVIGLAGAGKSTLLAAARTAWERGGYRVVGAALAGKAAAGLERSAGITSRTLASWEHRFENGTESLGPKDVLVIDEAGMIGTRRLARLVDHARRAGAKLVLVGDPQQLQPIEAGTPFRELVQRIRPAMLTEIRRQRDDWQREASQHLARQRIGEAVRLYEERGCVKVAASRLSAVAALVEDYMVDLELHGPDASRIALAHRRKDVHLINQTIRAARRSGGELADERLFETDHGPRAFASGDRILLTRNDRELGVHNGMLGTVERVQSNSLTIRIDGEPGETPRRVTIAPEEYAAMDHGYATTIHKAQGATVDRAFLLTSNRMDGHIAYVGLTRHREEVRLYADDADFQRLTRDTSLSPERDDRRRDGPSLPRRDR